MPDRKSSFCLCGLKPFGRLTQILARNSGGSQWPYADAAIRLKIQLDLHQMEKEKNVATSTIIVTGVIVTVEEFMSNIRRMFFLVEHGCVV